MDRSGLPPRAARAYEIIISKAHLMVEDEMPGRLLQFLARKRAMTW